MDVIRFACHRVDSPNWTQRTSADLVAAVVAQHSLKPLGLTEFFVAAVAEGAVRVELSKVMGFDELARIARDALVAGDLQQVQVLAQVAADLIGWTAPTVTSVSAVIAANTLRLVDIVAAEMGVEAPATVTASDVDAALGRQV